MQSSPGMCPPPGHTRACQRCLPACLVARTGSALYTLRPMCNALFFFSFSTSFSLSQFQVAEAAEEEKRYEQLDVTGPPSPPWRPLGGSRYRERAGGPAAGAPFGNSSLCRVSPRCKCATVWGGLLVGSSATGLFLSDATCWLFQLDANCWLFS